MLSDVILLLVTVGVLVTIYLKRKYRYWQRRKVQHLEPEMFYGNLVGFARGKESMGVALKHIYGELKSRGWKYGGVYFFTTPACVVMDPEHIRDVMVKDFHHFVDRVTYVNKRDDPLSANLVNLNGTEWKNLRAKLTPTFTSGKMKMMLQSVSDCRRGLEKRLGSEAAKGRPINIKDVLACFTTDVIGSAAFGLNCKSFEEENSLFRVYGQKAFSMTTFRRLKRTFCINVPTLARFLRLTITPKDVADFYRKVVKDTVSYREENAVTRNDFMQLLINTRNSERMTMDEVTAQSFVFFLAGFETSSTLMTFAMYELATNQDIQEKLREEVERVLEEHGGEFTYDAIQDMKYMDRVIDETLRKHPPAPAVNRKCVKDYKLSGTDAVIEKGTQVVVPIIGLHHDEEYYPDPEKFDPERFTEDNIKLRPNYTFLPFGEGPRICIGLRFALMESKVGLGVLVKNFKFTVNKKTREPLRMKVNSLIQAAEGEIWLNAEKL